MALLTTFHFLFCFFLLQLLASSSSALIGDRRRQGHFGNLQVCDIFSGSWVEDDKYPMYEYSSCPVIDPEFNCQLFGRPDSAYLHYRWQPSDCRLPIFNGMNFLERMRGKKVMFIGDSLGRNQWESLICMLHSAAEQSQTRFIRGDPLSTFKFMEFGVTISFYRAPYLVDIDSEEGRRILKLDSISRNSSSVWKEADVLLFNSGHWWTHRGSLQGWDYMGDGGAYYMDMDRLIAFGKGLNTWASWVDNNVDCTKTKVFFQSISPTHYNPAEWSDHHVSTNCYGETNPVSGRNYSGPYPDQMHIIKGIIKAMTYPVYLLDITTLSELRKDGHPSIYSGDLSPEQRSSPEHSADCSHWCLPGLPDTWNQLLYTALFF